MTTNIAKIIEKEKEILHHNKKEIEVINFRIFKILILLAFGTSCIMSALSTINPAFSLLKNPYYLLCVITLLLIVFFYKNHRGISVIFLLYFFYSCVFAFSVYTGIIVVPDETSSLILGFIFIFSTTFHDKTMRVLTVSILFAFIYSIFALAFKNKAALALDIVNVWGYTIFANLLGANLKRIQIENLELKNIIQKQAMTDPLTGLMNRTTLKELSQNKDLLNDISSIVMMDIDYFKSYNDNYGHQAGDECLVLLAKVFLSMEEKYTITFYRYGGEEFLATIKNTDPEQTLQIMNEIHDGIAKLAIPHKESLHKVVTISCGVVTVNNEQSFYNLVGQADKALYKSKMEGRNKITFAET